MRVLEIRARRVKTRGEATVMWTTGVFLTSVGSYGSEGHKDGDYRVKSHRDHGRHA